MNYLEKEAEVETLGPNSLLIASYLAKRMDVRVQMIGKNGDVVADTQRERFFIGILILRVP